MLQARKAEMDVDLEGFFFILMVLNGGDGETVLNGERKGTIYVTSSGGERRRY